MSFRVSELQVLLGYAGRNKSGRKHELQARALNLLKNGCATPVQIKIKDLYRRRFPRRMITPTQYMSSNGGEPPPPSGPPPPYTSSMQLTAPPAHQLPSPLNPPPIPQQPIHPDVKYKHLPFYDSLGELLKPTGLSKYKQCRFVWVYDVCYVKLFKDFYHFNNFDLGYLFEPQQKSVAFLDFFFLLILLHIVLSPLQVLYSFYHTLKIKSQSFQSIFLVFLMLGSL